MGAVKYNCLCYNVLFLRCHRKRLSVGNAVDTYCGDGWPESQPGHFLY
jgi:hypothetical protein